MTSIRVLVVDDHILFRQGLVGLLENQPNYTVVGEAGSVQKAVEKAKQLKPDLILLDISLPDGNGLEAANQILPALPSCKIVFLTAHEEDETLFQALRSGASGYLLKNLPVDALVNSLDGLTRGEIALTGAMTTRVVQEFARTETLTPQAPANLEKLSRRERDVFMELAEGYSNQEIAQRLFVSENTVKHHIHSILTKLGLRNRQEVALYAKKLG